jgi:tRNA(fMet)-specific endonuclease VapC
VADRIRRSHTAELRTTIITAEESLAGWYALIRKARRDEQIVSAYRGFLRAMETFQKVTILGFDTGAMATFRRLRRMLPRLGTNDLRIAAICLENDATLVTRNVRDFQQVPGLPIEEWSR